ncbi:FAD-dependent oxidoreductase [Alicyclobacillus acidiphilus]|uniref:FAD-dependent oxidoreductase n=1 Tax=Alicyclobacillus acidiphilus TaxID=182455 RepID=UPI00082EE750|nr:FAD-dependent oxidoreductase [Alicyclobacillus acidiphilus]
MIQKTHSYDVVVVGGGSAGVAAAVGAANVGAKTLLIEKNPYFGGASTHSSVLTICGLFAQQEPTTQVVGGVGQTFLNHLARLGRYDGPFRNPGSGNVIVPLDGETTKFALDQLVLDAGVIPRLHTMVIGADVDGRQLRAIECFHHGGPFTVEGAAFVDASGEADLATFAGADVRYGGNEGRVQAGTLVMQFGGVAPDISIHRHQFTAAVWQAKRAGMDYLTKDRGMVVRLAGSNHVLALFADEDVNGLDSESLTQAEMSGRRQAWGYLEAFRQYVPGFKDAYLVQTGPAIGVRETRHVSGEYRLAGEEAIHGARFEDAIARGGWPVEIHEPGEAARYQQIKDKSYYEIPLRTLKVDRIDNLWCAGRIIDCDPIAFASARVMGTAFATGHAAGVAAALHASVGRVAAADVRRELIRQGAIL